MKFSSFYVSKGDFSVFSDTAKIFIESSSDATKVVLKTF